MSIIIADAGTFLFLRLVPDKFSKPTLLIQFDDVDIPALDLAAYVWLLCLVRWNPFL